MTDRSAVDTIKGYFYQFDMSILSILSLADASDSISIECVEDIDIKTATEVTAVQCKYYSKTEYNHSVIQKAVRYMLSHFKEVKLGNKPKIQYAIRGHYSSGQNKLPSNFDVDYLKQHFLTYTSKSITHQHHLELGLSDSELTEFLSCLTVDVNALEFEAQLREVVQQLQNIFCCDSFSAEFFYYNNALRLIKELSVGPTSNDRTITKKQFLEKINTSNILFNDWFVQRKGKKLHLASIRSEYFTTLNVSPFERFFLFEVDQNFYVRDELKQLIFLLSKKWSKLGRLEPKPFCPYLFIQGIAPDELAAIKNDLSNEGLKVTDGYGFLGADFDPENLCGAATHGNGIRIKILNSVLDLQMAINFTNKKTRLIYQFHLGKSYFQFKDPAVGHVEIQVQSLSDIKEII